MKDNKKKATQVTRGLIEYLRKTDQLSILPQLVKESMKKSQAERDPSIATVATVIKLTNSELGQIKDILSKQTGLDVKVKNVVDDSIIGGMRIRIGDKVIDNTIKQKLQNLGERLAS